MDQRGSALALPRFENHLPLADEKIHVGPQVVLAFTLRNGPHDEPAAGRPQPLDKAAQALLLLFVLDAPRDADVIDRRHEHEVASRQGDVRGDAGALGADRLLGHLHQDLLTLLQQLLDMRQLLFLLGQVLRRSRRAIAAVGELLDRLDLVEHVGDVKKGGLLQADIDEGRLHPRQHADDPPLVNVAHDSAISTALDVELGDVAALQQRHPGFVGGRVDDQLLGHDISPESMNCLYRQKLNSLSVEPAPRKALTQRRQENDKTQRMEMRIQ